MWLRLDGAGPRYRQLYRALRDAIVSGTLAPGARAPATRVLATELGLSRTTILLAYEQLTAEGYLVGRHGSGSYAQRVEPAAMAAPSAPASAREPPHLSRVGTRVAATTRPIFSAYASGRPVLPYDFRYAAPAMRDFPLQAWQRCLGRCSRRAPLRAYDYGPPQGSVALRTALAAYLRRARGVVCEPEQILLLSGSQQGLDLAARLLLDAGDGAVVEEPGYEGARRAFAAAGGRLIHVGVDADGLRVTGASGLRARARLAHVTPSHQYPLGGVMPYARRVTLLAWAARVGAYVIEDDYDGEYRFEGRPVDALKALDRGERVLYLGTFSKVMFPALRVGYLVLPPALVEPFTRARLLADGGSPFLEHEALAEFIASGIFERHLRRSRARNRERRAAVLAALAQHLGDAGEVCGANAGLHVVVWLRDVPARETRGVLRRAAARGVGLYSVAPYYETPPSRVGLLLGYGALSPRDIRTGIARLGEALR